ncbi:hypothetical protein GGR52DRAFT_576305 [Hypoxylon sp. FL1284]|nr:hypothetical protein GGR52DRAFT_576305 [Hypoxylon sp. FL1284]
MAKPERTNIQGRSRRTKRLSRLVLALLTTSAFIAAVVLGAFVLVGCVSTSRATSDLFLAELHVNKTYDIRLRFGYFGGCVLMTGLPPPAAGADSGAQSYCVVNMRASSADDLSQEFREKLGLSDSPQAALAAALAAAKHLQADVFAWEPPLVAVLLVVVSSLMLVVALTAASPRRRYKATLLVSALLGGLAVALALTTDIGSRQAANALLGGGAAATVAPLVLGDGILVQRTDLQYVVQDASAACTILLYVILGVLFVRRTADDDNNRKPLAFPQFAFFANGVHS